MHYMNQGDKESFKAGLEFLHEAIDKDPGDPFAYAALALGYATQGHGQVNAEEAFNRAVSAAKKAIKIDKINQYLHAGDCYQVNLAQRFQARYSGSEWQAYKQLRQSNQAPFSAFIHLPDSCFLSISPERFFSVKNNLVESKPIKGTRPRDNDPRVDEQNRQALLHSEKDKAENLMIADLLRNETKRHALGNAGRTRVQQHFSWQRTAQQMVEHYRGVVV